MKLDDLGNMWTNSYYQQPDRNGRVYSPELQKQIMDYLEKSSNEYYMPPKPPTIEERVIDIVKGGFEKKFGITIQEFQEVYDKLVEDEPDRLI